MLPPLCSQFIKPILEFLFTSTKKNNAYLILGTALVLSRAVDKINLQRIATAVTLFQAGCHKIALDH